MDKHEREYISRRIVSRVVTRLKETLISIMRCNALGAFLMKEKIEKKEFFNNNNQIFFLMSELKKGIRQTII